MLGQNLKQLYESLGPVECNARLSDGLDRGLFKPEDFSVRELAEAFCGHDWVSRLNPRNLARYSSVPLLEAGEGVDVSSFSNITGQIFFNKIMEGWRLASRVADALCTTMPTRLAGEKMPWIGNLETEGDEIHAGMPYPEYGLTERYIETPNTKKQGGIVSVTKEAIFFDLTGQLLRRAAMIGEKLGYNREKQILRVVLGITNNYKLNGTTYNTYVASGGSWVNKLGSWPLVDYTSVEKPYILASQNTDPESGLPIQVDFNTLFVMPAKVFTAKRLLNATEIETTYPGYTSTANPAAPGNVSMKTGNPLPDQLNLLTSPIAHQLLTVEASGPPSAANAGDYWYIGDFKKAFAWMENWPLTVETAPANSTKEFEQDIVFRTKASFMGIAAVLEPRQVFWFYDA